MMHVLLAIGLSVFSGIAFGHKTLTHGHITRLAVEYLKSKAPWLSCMNDKQLQIGASAADATPLFMFHFNPRLDGEVQVSDYLGARKVSATCNSSDWGLATNPSCTETGGRWYWDSKETFVNKRTWSAAVKNAKDAFGGQSDKGWEDLGYVLHLLQDLTSPAHTRNDPHPGGNEADPVEGKIRIPALPTGSLMYLGKPEDYFNRLQQWTRNNFYSKDTVFQSPGPAAARVEGKYFLDSAGRKIAHRGVIYLASGEIDSERDPTLATIDHVVAEEQWTELGPQAVLYAASFISFYNFLAKPLSCGSIEIKAAACTLEYDKQGIPYYNWTIRGTASSRDAPVLPMAFSDPFYGYPPGTRLSTCDRWTGTTSYSNGSSYYCARRENDPVSTNWTTTGKTWVGGGPSIALKAELILASALEFKFLMVLSTSYGNMYCPQYFFGESYSGR